MVDESRSPVEEQQEPSLEDALAAEFDRLEDESEAEPEVAEAEEAEEVEEVAEKEEIAEEVAAGEIDYNEPPPERWPAELKDAYNELPAKQRQLMMERIFKPMQRTYTQSTQEIAEARKALDPILQTLDQNKQVFEGMGIDPIDAFNRQMAWARHFATVGPEQGMKDMASAYGLNKQPQGQTEEEYLTPVERSLKQRLDQMENERLQQHYMNQQQAEQWHQAQVQRQAQEIQMSLNQFATETQNGKPAHPHVEKVAPAMAGLIRGGLVNRTDEYGQPVPYLDQLAQAYKLACDLDPSIRTVTSSGQAKRAKAARSVGIKETPSRGSGDEADGLTLAETIEREYDRLQRKAG